MKASERDELLGRLDERTRNTYTLMEKQEKHLDKLNGRLDGYSMRLTTVEVLQKERGKPSKKTIGGYLTGVTAIVVALWKAFVG